METISGQVQVPHHYFFDMAQKDYSNWKSAFVREFLQNSLDAGATNIDISIDTENNSITFEDNGHGMDKDTIVNKLLCLGGSGKRTNAVGAFGKAKEILYFSWDSYIINTKKYKIKGQGNNYSIEETHSTQGTRSTIFIGDPDLLVSLSWSIPSVVSLFEVDASINLDGNQLVGNLKREDCLFEGDWFKLYKANSDIGIGKVYIRINGMWMFDTFIFDDTDNDYILEIDNNSLEILTSNRDGFVDSYEMKFRGIVSAIDKGITKMKAMADKNTIEAVVGDGPIYVKNKELEQFYSQLSNEPEVSDITQEESNCSFSDNSKIVLAESFKQTFTDFSKQNQLEEIKNQLSSFASSIHFKTRESKKKIDNITHSYLLDIPYRTSQINSFLSHSKARIILNMWAQVLKQIIIDNEIESQIPDFIPGFTFEEETKASFLNKTDDGYERVFFINPFAIGKEIDVHKKILTNRAVLVEELKFRACHEITHALGYNYHNDNFVTANASVFTKTIKSMKKYKEISKIK
jgi:hypothetical protein